MNVPNEEAWRIDPTVELNGNGGEEHDGHHQDHHHGGGEHDGHHHINDWNTVHGKDIQPTFNLQLQV